METSKPGMFWCLGLYASGSTWLFNAGKKIAAASEMGGAIESRFATQGSDLTFAPTTSIAIIKTHEVDRDAAGILLTKAEAIWLSVRDPRDCITSLMLYQQCTFDEALEMLCDVASFCLTTVDMPNTFLFKFEDRFYNDIETLSRIASGLGTRLTDANAQRIFSELSRSSIEALIRRFEKMPTVVTQPEPGHLVDLDTQWHTHHSGRNGEIGRWRKTLSNDQQRAVLSELAVFMNRFGYSD